MNILNLLGKRFSNGAEIKLKNYLDLTRDRLATEKDLKLLEKVRKSNLQKS